MCIRDSNNIVRSGVGSTVLSLTGNSGVNTATISQIAFPAAQNASSNANTLDDYEEGTWTPALAGNATAGTQTYSAQVGQYQKIGKRVNIDVSILLSAK